MTDFNSLAALLADILKAGLQQRVNDIEDALRCKLKGAESILPQGLAFVGFDEVVDVKRAFGRINELVHVAGILRCLDKILIEGEIVCSASLGAGPRSEFDLVTNHRIAEFKFARWDSGTNAARKRGLIKDYLKLLMFEDGRKKQLYVYDRDRVIAFLKSEKGMETLLSKNAQLKKLYEAFLMREKRRVNCVGELYHAYENRIEIVDLADYLAGIE